MAKTVVIDEIHLTLRVPHDLPGRRVEAIRRALAAERFTRRLRREVRAVVRAFPELAPVRTALAR